MRPAPKMCWRALAVVILASCFAACSNEGALIVIGGSSMGTSWSVKAVATGTDSSEALTQSLQQELDALEALMSTWRDDSEVSQFNAAAVGCYEVSNATATVIASALNISQQTGGAFDITIGPLIRLWGFGKRFTGDQVPTDTEISALMDTTGYQQLKLEGQRLCKQHADVFINLSALAKGYAVDQVAEKLTERGYEHYLVEVGGELYAKGQSPAGRPWTIGIEQPISDGRAIMNGVAVPVQNQGVATSGDYRNYFEEGGKRYSHILNPVSGKPVSHQLASVTVLARNAMAADAWATALLVMGVNRGLELANTKGLAVLMITHADGGFKVYSSEAWLQ